VAIVADMAIKRTVVCLRMRVGVKHWEWYSFMNVLNSELK